MKHRYLYFILLITLISACRKKTTPTASSYQKILISICRTYLGTPYKFGGIDKNGMDCSGMVYASFLQMGIKLPRISHQQADYFEEVSLKDIREGDLVYFRVSGKKINHTGVITDIVSKDEVMFIHSSTSKGVREDNLFSKFWEGKFVKATRPQF